MTPLLLPHHPPAVAIYVTAPRAGARARATRLSASRSSRKRYVVSRYGCVMKRVTKDGGGGARGRMVAAAGARGRVRWLMCYTSERGGEGGRDTRVGEGVGLV